VTSDPSTVAADILAEIDVAIACGATGKQQVDRFAQAVGARALAESVRAPSHEEALVWFHRTEQAPTLVRFTPGITKKRTIPDEVGRLLRRA
jgi:hypothetical protein